MGRKVRDVVIINNFIVYIIHFYTGNEPQWTFVSIGRQDKLAFDIQVIALAWEKSPLNQVKIDTIYSNISNK